MYANKNKPKPTTKHHQPTTNKPPTHKTNKKLQTLQKRKQGSVCGLASPLPTLKVQLYHHLVPY